MSSVLFSTGSGRLFAKCFGAELKKKMYGPGQAEYLRYLQIYIVF